MNPDINQDLLNLPFRYNNRKRDFFLKRKRLLDAHYAKKFKQLNAKVIDELDQFIDKSFDANDELQFPGRRQLRGAVLVLDMQTSDHEPTLALIQDHVEKRNKLMGTIRLKSTITRKRNLLDVLKEKKHSRLFVMVENTETFDYDLSNVLVGHLTGRLLEGSAEVIMVLFCVSTKIQGLSIDTNDTFGKLTLINRDKEVASRELLEDLLRSKETEFKLGKKCLDYIYESYINCDASISNLKYLHQYAMFEYYSKLNNIEESANKQNGDRDPMLNKSQLKAASEYHKYLCNQMYYFYDLTHDSGKFPEDITDIYDELLENDDLAQSVNFINAIKDIIKFPHSSLLRRIDLVDKRYRMAPKTIYDKRDVTRIIFNYKDKILNNEDCKKIVMSLVDELIVFSQGLTNPLHGTNRKIYFNNTETFMERTLPSARYEKSVERFVDGSTDFSILYSLIHSSTSEISIADLFNDFVPMLEEWIEKNKPKSKKMKQTVSSRTLRRTTRAEKERSEVLDDGLAKAIFIDILLSMEDQGLIKLELRTSRRGMIKKIIWL